MARLLLVLVLAVAAAVAQPLPACASVAPSPSSLYRCGWCSRRSTASILPPDAGALTGAACGYGDPAELAADGGFHIAAVGAGFFRGGQACGACYQLRCRDRSACSEGGVKVIVVADVPKVNRTAGVVGGGKFLLSKDAFAALTTAGHSGQLASLVDTAVDVDFRRIPCMYNSKNLAVRVEETSNRDKGHLALCFLYQGGQTDIVAVEVAQATRLRIEIVVIVLMHALHEWVGELSALGIRHLAGGSKSKNLAAIADSYSTVFSMELIL
ncbi:hypothetical protein TRIUR3_11791 [Triticum urartu]|uniref:Uncharacterized protein n=1 Tax=Triticum urartu TaxID=4572 RepID=M7YJ52_TRIUA|nr:hypothetical protein TRIUR3_11791 [Triticum urartu]